MSTTVKIDSAASRVVWNKGRLVGQKRPLRPKEVWAIRVRLQIEDRKPDLVLFNLAIDSKLRGCDLVSLRVDDIAAFPLSKNERRLSSIKPAVQFSSKSWSRRGFRCRSGTAVGVLSDRFATFALAIRNSGFTSILFSNGGPWMAANKTMIS